MPLNQSLKVFIYLMVLFFSTAIQALCLNCTCTASAPTLAFGTFQPLLGAALTGSTTLTVHCTALASVLDTVTVALSKGSASSFTPRTMLSGANTINYNLYVPTSLGGVGTGYTTIWGDGTGGTSTVSQTVIIAILGTNIDYPINGQIAAAQNTVTPGSYSDTITATVTY